MIERDEYAASHRQGLGCGLWLMWFVATTLGALLGQVAAQNIVWALVPDNTLSTIPPIWLLAAAGAVMGTLIGLAQGLVLLRYIKLNGFVEWIAASAAGGVLIWTIVAPIGEYLLKTIDLGIAVCTMLIPVIIYGTLAGTVFGLLQSLVFERQLGHVTTLDQPAWILGNAAGGIFSIPFITLSGLTGGAIVVLGGVVDAGHAAGAAAVVAISWAVAGLVTGLALRDRLRYSPRLNQPDDLIF